MSLLSVIVIQHGMKYHGISTVGVVFQVYIRLYPIPINTVLTSLNFLVIKRLLMEDDTINIFKLGCNFKLQGLPVPLISYHIISNFTTQIRSHDV
jgi:hypothetical protein